MRKGKSRAVFGLPVLSLLTVFAFAACDASERDVGEEMPELDDEETRVEDDDGSLLAPADTIHVALSDFAIDMSRTLEAGPVAFHVMNEGSTAHNFEIEGQGEEESLSEDLPAGETDVIVMELEPGTYEIYCPVGDHGDKGMHLQIRVQ
jgi:uncharacterized cupredoxin-like copper-binding protein